MVRKNDKVLPSNTLVVKRVCSSNYGTFGLLFFGDSFICSTLEPESTDGLKYHGVQRGSYPLFITYSPKFQRLLPEFRVLGRSGLRIHHGNYVTDTHGCLLVGKFDVNRLIDSKKTLLKVIELIRKKHIKYIEFVE